MSEKHEFSLGDKSSRKRTLDGLPNECILQIMHHLEIPTNLRKWSEEKTMIRIVCMGAGKQDHTKELPRHVQDPDSHDREFPKNLCSLTNFILSSSRAFRLFKDDFRSILIGIQEKQFPHSLILFGRAGRQTPTQMLNIKRSIVTTHLQNGWEGYGPMNLEPVLETGKGLYDLRFLVFLGKLDKEMDHHLRCCRQTTFGGYMEIEHISVDTAKRALFTLFGMGWCNLKPQRQQGVSPLDLEIDWTLNFFLQQPEEVKSCAREILFHLGKELQYQGSLLLYSRIFARCVCMWFNWADNSPEVESCMNRQLDGINATVLIRILAYGVDQVFDEIEGIDSMIQPVWVTDMIYNKKFMVEAGIAWATEEDLLAFRKLDEHIELANMLGYDVFRDDRLGLCLCNMKMTG